MSTSSQNRLLCSLHLRAGFARGCLGCEVSRLAERAIQSHFGTERTYLPPNVDADMLRLLLSVDTVAVEPPPQQQQRIRRREPLEATLPDDD